MDYAALNRAQLILNTAARLEKKAGLPGELANYLMRAGKNVGKAGYEATTGAAKSLRAAGHPILGAAALAAPVVGGLAVAGHLRNKYRMWQAIRQARKQGYVQ